MSNVGRLVLGTAQLGFSYGVGNKTGQPDLNEAVQIVSTAWDAGIREFDTAQVYGNSEQVLGEIFEKLGISRQAKVVSKLAFQDDSFSVSSVQMATEKSLHCLGIERLSGLMLHIQEAIRWPDSKRVFSSLVERGLVSHIGVSVYTPEFASEALELDWIDMIQLPGNALDRRFELAGVYELAEKRNKSIYVRSAFLQGLLLMERSEIPDDMEFAVPYVVAFSALAEELGITRHELALVYLRDSWPQTRVLFGAETPQQVSGNVNAWNIAVSKNIPSLVRSRFKEVDEKVVDPRSWPMYS